MLRDDANGKQLARFEDAASMQRGFGCGLLSDLFRSTARSVFLMTDPILSKPKSARPRPGNLKPRPKRKRKLNLDPDHVYIREAAELLGRRIGTLRKWEQQEILPPELMPNRGYRGWRFWTHDQIEEIKDWLRDTNRYSGTALPHYNPTEKKLDEAIEKMRRPHSSRRRLEEIA